MARKARKKKPLQVKDLKMHVVEAGMTVTYKSQKYKPKIIKESEMNGER